MATKLEQLLIKEVSGVDDPANETPGWLVLKSETAQDGAPSLAGRLMSRLSKSGTTGRTDIEVTSDELGAELDSRFETLGASLVETLSKSVAPVEGASGTEDAPAVKSAEEIAAEVEATKAATIEAVSKAVEDTLQPVLEVLDKALDRIAGCEKALGMVARKSLEGQENGESGEVEKNAPAPTIGDAIGAALKGRTVTLT